jgi:hypothetical protein
VARVDEHQPRTELRGKLGALHDRVGIAVYGDDFAVGSFENGLRVAAGAERPVDDDRAVFRLKRADHLRK